MPDPTIPGEVPAGEPLWLLVGTLDNRSALLGHHQLGDLDLTPEVLHGLHCTVLAYRAAITERVTAEFWPAAVRALDDGTGHEQVAAALGLTSGELAERLGDWADEQLKAKAITPARHSEVLVLAGFPFPGSDPERRCSP